MDLCELHGECCFAAPEVFQLDDDDVLHYESEPSEDLRAKVRMAVNVCPTRAISQED
jgi:ferredoxin